jgi:hypothetical protein
MAVKTALLNILCIITAVSNAKADANHARLRARAKTGRDSFVEKIINIVIVEGPAINGTANGTMKGGTVFGTSDSPGLASMGKIILTAIKKEQCLQPHATSPDLYVDGPL